MANRSLLSELSVSVSLRSLLPLRLRSAENRYERGGWIELLGRTVSIGSPQFTLRRDLLEDPTTVVTLLHEYSHYMLLSTTLGNSFTCLIMSCFCLDSYLRELDTSSANQGDISQYLGILRTLVDTRLRLAALFQLWRPFIEGFGVFSEHDTAHANEFFTDIGHLIAELRMSGRAVNELVIQQMQHPDPKEETKLEYDDVRSKIVVQELSELGDRIIEAQKWAVEKDRVVLMTDTLREVDLRRRDVAYLSGYSYIRYLQGRLSKIDSRLRDPTFFWMFLVRLMRSEFGRLDLELLKLPYEDFLGRVRVDLFGCFSQLESVEGERLSLICDEIEALKAQESPILPKYDLWNFLAKGSTVPLPTDPIEAQADFCGRIIETVLAKFRVGKEGLETYKTALASIRHFFIPTLFQGYSYEECKWIRMPRDKESKDIAIAIALQSGAGLMLLLPRESASEFLEFLSYVESQQPSALRLMQVVKYDPSSGRRYRTHFVLECAERVCLLPGLGELDGEELEELRQRLSSSFIERRNHIQAAAEFQLKEFKKAVGAFSSNKMPGSLTERAAHLHLQVSSWLQQLEAFADSVTLDYLRLALPLKEEALRRFKEKGVLFICSNKNEERILEFLMTRWSAASIASVSDACSLATAEITGYIERINSRSTGEMGYRIIEISNGKFRYVRPGGTPL